MNKLFNQLNKSQPKNLSLLNRLKAIKNPQAVLQKMIEQNPQIQVALNMSNGNMEQAFYALAKQKGVDPNEILSQLK